MTSSTVKCHWLVSLGIDLHRIQFTQNMKTAKASLSIDEKIQYANVSKLSSEERFAIGTHLLIITFHPSRDEPLHGTYELTIDGLSFQEHRSQQNRRYARWSAHQNRQKFHVVLDKNSMDVFVNGAKTSAKHFFEGPDTVVSFQLVLREGHRVPCRIVTPGNTAPSHKLYVRDETWPLLIDENTGVFPARQVLRGILTDD